MMRVGDQSLAAPGRWVGTGKRCAGALVSVAATIIAPTSFAQSMSNPIPNSGGALIMQKDSLPDPLQAGWKGKEVCKVIEENEKMRALLCTFPPGVGHERHFHAAHFGYVLEGGRMRIKDKSGVSERDIKSGSSWTSDGVEWHEALNIGGATATYLIVEPKGSFE